MRNPSVKADEFALYALAHLMNWHVLVDLKDNWWTTVKMQVI